MTEAEKTVLETLIELDQAVQSMPSVSPKPDLLALFARLDELAKQLPPDTDTELRHFLQRKSYEKARRLLEGRGAENAKGSCRHELNLKSGMTGCKTSNRMSGTNFSPSDKFDI